jgi:hypothetical protein
MYQLLHGLASSDIFKRQLPIFLVAFLIAEFFYKFHSFALECGAFLVTWYALDAVAQLLLGRKSTDG